MLASRGQGSGINIVPALSPAAWFRFGIGITTTGAGVSTWADQSGNGRDLLQAVDAARPPKQADGSILFDGVAQFLKCSAFTLNQPLSIYLLMRQVTWTASDRIFDGDTDDSAEVLQPATASPALRQFAGLQGTDNTDLTVNVYGVVSTVFNGASSVLQINNNAATISNAGAQNAGGFTLGRRGVTAVNFANIQVKEVIHFSTAHDADTRARVIRYLGAVGGVAV